MRRRGHFKDKLLYMFIIKIIFVFFIHFKAYTQNA